MRILFYNPPFLPEKGYFPLESRSPAVAQRGTLYYPIWLAYAKGVAEAAGHEILLLNAPALGIDTALLSASLGVSVLNVVNTSTPSICSDVREAEGIKERYPGSFILLVSTIHLQCLKKRLHFSVVWMTLPSVSMTVRFGTLQRLWEKGGILFLFPASYCGRGAYPLSGGKITDLDALPFVSTVDKIHLNLKDYFFVTARYPMSMTSRGCPFGCIKRSPENVVAEFEYIRDNLPEVTEIAIEDDCFTADSARVRDILRLLIECGIFLPWYCDALGDVDAEVLLLMKKAGCRLLSRDSRARISRFLMPCINRRNRKRTGMLSGMHGVRVCSCIGA